MRRQMLGKSMLEVPVVAAGCMRIQGMDETEVDEYIHTCLELGIQFLIMRIFMEKGHANLCSDVYSSRQNFAEKISSCSLNAGLYRV